MTGLDFWTGNQPGFRFARSPVGTRAFFDEVTAHRYELEPHIADVVGFERWSGRDVLEAGCGIGTDGARFSAAGARYTGLDATGSALALARRRFALDDLPGRFVAGSVTRLPFPDESFDLVFSHGVVHHVDDTGAAVRELHRVLRPGGTLLVMVYHRRSFNYYVTVMLVRRLLAALLLLPSVAPRLARLTGEAEEVLAGHRELLVTHGTRYLRDHRLFLSNNTDGPGNRLSKAYSRAELRQLVPPELRPLRTDVRYLNLRLYPGGTRLASTRLATLAERRVGWHLYLEGTKSEGAGSSGRGDGRPT